MKGRLSKLVIQALRELGKAEVSTEMIAKLRERLSGEDPLLVKHDLALAPEWIKRLLGNDRKEGVDG